MMRFFSFKKYNWLIKTSDESGEYKIELRQKPIFAIELYKAIKQFCPEAKLYRNGKLVKKV